MSKEPDNLVILCPFCNAPYTANMKSQFEYSMGSEWTGMYNEHVVIEIHCDNCKKLVYKKNDYDV